MPAPALAKLLVLCGMVLLGPGRAVTATALDPARVTWSKLSYRASKLGISTRSEVALSRASAAEVRKALITPGEGRGIVAPGSAWLLEITSRFLGRHSSSRIWFAPTTGQTYQRLQLDTGKRRRYKVNRFTTEGVFTVRRYPRKHEDGDDPSQWTDRSETFYPFPRSHPVVIEPGVLFYLVSAADLTRPGQSAEAVFFSRKDTAVAEIRVEGRTQVRVDYQERSPLGGSRRVKRDVPAVEISVRAKSAGERIELIGLEGDVVLFLDPETRVPLQVSGRIDVAGKVNVRLKEVVLEQRE